MLRSPVAMGTASPPASAGRTASMRRVLVVEAAANLAAAGAKLAVGLASGSAALVGDAVHSLTDLANNGVALLAAHLAGAPPDSEHHYGHGKIESLAVFSLAMILVVLAVQVAWGSGQGHTAVATSRWGLVTMLAVMAFQLVVSRWEAGWARRLDSDLLLADSRHTLSDFVVTGGVLIGWQLAARGHLWADRLAAWAVSALVLYLAWGLFQRAVPVLIDRSWLAPDELRRAVEDVPGVRAVRSVRSLGRGEQMRVDVTVAVDGELSLQEAHRIADAVEERVATRFGATDVSVHVEPSEP